MRATGHSRGDYIVVAIFGIIFGILGIFTVGLLFTPLVALCALFGFLSGVVHRRPSIVFLAIVAAILAGAGFVTSPTLWLAAAAIAGHH